MGASWGVLGASWEMKKHVFVFVFFNVFAFLGLTGTSCLSFRLEGVLGASWEHLGRVLGPSWTVMVASWGVLWLSWGVLWASWGRLGLPKSSQDRSKRPPRRLQEASQNDVNLGRWGTPENLLKPMKKQEFYKPGVSIGTGSALQVKPRGNTSQSD